MESSLRNLAQPVNDRDESSCPNLPCVSKYRDTTLKISFMGIMRILFNRINTSMITAELKLAINKIPSELRSEICAEILLFIIRNAQKAGWVGSLKNAFLSLIAVSPGSAKVDKGMLLLHTLCAPNTNCEIDKDVGLALLAAYPEGVSSLAITPFGEVTPLLLLLMSPHVDFQLVSAMVQANPTSARLSVNGKLPIHYVLMLSSSTVDSHSYYDMIDAVRHLLAAYPQGAFVDVTEKTIQLLVLGPVRSPETATEVGSPSSGDDDTTDSTNSSSSSSVGEPVSSQTIRITIRSQADDLESAAGQNPTDGSDSAQLKQSWNPYQKSLQGSDRMLREVFSNHARSMAPKSIFMRSRSAKF